MKADLKNKNGFTILEIIVTLIVASILGAILLQVMGTNMQRSYEPVNRVQKGFSVCDIMEKMNAQYRKRLLTSNVNPLDDFKTDVENGNISSNDPYFGDYTFQTQYIIFTGGNEAPDSLSENRILKVTITSGDQSATALFTR